jgi:hypothetical protein
LALSQLLFVVSGAQASLAQKNHHDRIPGLTRRSTDANNSSENYEPTATRTEKLWLKHRQLPSQFDHDRGRGSTSVLDTSDVIVRESYQFISLHTERNLRGNSATLYAQYCRDMKTCFDSDFDKKVSSVRLWGM